ncbi:NAD(P)/FAD-dependent oxidoreductase [Geopsychrobacter electrodiphilus]|uniref:NAD(P)/FAD-dependent oxidoreductase n=1 Tax=Geopsychrobacter electrodiphilus TaxID=225196 RepID=UPI000365940A|nr:NAD(P)/FAD-dependent oxidoreductase [Geopsychrobacter electrodiphilus]
MITVLLDHRWCADVSLKDIDMRSMRSKKIANLYFAGEMIDLDGPTGGFNLQVC